MPVSMEINPVFWQFVDWFHDLEWQWVDLIGGTVVAVAVLLWEKFIAHKPLSYKGWVAGFVVAFVIANFLAWKQQADQVSQLGQNLGFETFKEQSLEARTYPNLQASIQDVWTYRLGAASGAILMVDIRNVGGAPSTADYWVIYAKLRKGPGDKVQLGSYAPQVPFTLHYRGGDLHYKSDYWLANRTVLSPIPTGGDVKGYLNAVLPAGVDPKDIDYSTISLTFNDVMGQTHDSMAVPYNLNPGYVPTPTLDQP